MTLKIDGKTVEAEGFIFDGCHKIYLVDGPAAKAQLFDSGWDRSDVRPLHQLPTVWEVSCPLRFINSGDLKTDYVRQDRDGEPEVEWVDE
jgi:hypothetical protein